MPEPAYSRDQPPPSRRQSLTNRLLGSFNRAREETTKSIQRRASAAATTSSKQSPTARIREWLDTCNAEHQHHCHGIPDRSSGDDSNDTWRPVWLIDAAERKLVRSRPTDRYLALSYVWGNGPPPRRGATATPEQLLRSNVDAFQLKLPDEGIPQTILDAISLSKRIGIRLLWVDRLCIVQDDEEERENHIRHMPFVFANAYLTIVAAHGDVYTGLVPLNPNARRASAARPPRPIPKEHNELLLASRWNTRGWTLQELLYSRRAVFFFEETITWECHCELWQGGTTGATGLMKTMRGSRQNCTNRISSSAFGFQHAPWPDLEEYARIAADYSSRRVTYVDDTLRAYSGITHVLSRVFPGGFLYGMPLMFLDAALLWRPQAAIRRRVLSRPPFLPTWSWMGFWFDGVPADLTLWRASADYVEDTKISRRGQASKRFVPGHSFKLRPTIVWTLSDRTSSVPVQNNGYQFRDLRSRKASGAALPPGWEKAGSFFRHDSDEETVFKYPIPVEDPPEEGDYSPPPGELAFPGPFLAFKTTSGIFDVDFDATLAPRDTITPPIAVGNIWSRSDRWIGHFRAHDAWLGIQSSNYDGDERLEFIAISTAMERRGSHAFPTERYEENMDQDGILDIVNVLWIERISGIAYRRGIGHILLKAWEAQAREEVDILLG